MKKFFVTGAVLLFASQSLCQAYAVELCEPQDYYNLVNASKCSVQYKKTESKSDPRNSMFEIMKNYPFESKDALAKLLQRKIELIDNYKKQHQSQDQTEKSIVALKRLDNAKQVLTGQLGMVKKANKDNWVSVRDQASKALGEAAKSLREIE